MEIEDEVWISFCIPSFEFFSTFDRHAFGVVVLFVGKRSHVILMVGRVEEVRKEAFLLFRESKHFGKGRERHLEKAERVLEHDLSTTDGQGQNLGQFGPARCTACRVRPGSSRNRTLGNCEPGLSVSILLPLSTTNPENPGCTYSLQSERVRRCWRWRHTLDWVRGLPCLASSHCPSRRRDGLSLLGCAYRLLCVFWI